MNMIICPKCKKQIYENTEKCPFCGYMITGIENQNDDFVVPPLPVRTNNQPKQNYQTTFNNTAVKYTKKNSSKKNKNLIIAFAIVLVILIAVTTVMCIFTQQLYVNVLVTLASSVLPIITGLIFNIVGNADRTNKGIERFLHIYGSIFNCLNPFILLLAVFYLSGQLSIIMDRMAAPIITLSICFLGYMPAHYKTEQSFAKNSVLGVINILKNIFIWSFISGSVAAYDALRATSNIAHTTYNFNVFLPLLFKVMIILILFQTLKLIAEEFEDTRSLKINR